LSRAIGPLELENRALSLGRFEKQNGGPFEGATLLYGTLSDSDYSISRSVKGNGGAGSQRKGQGCLLGSLEVLP
jgi:hypothetical protein